MDQLNPGSSLPEYISVAVATVLTILGIWGMLMRSTTKSIALSDQIVEQAKQANSNLQIEVAAARAESERLRNDLKVALDDMMAIRGELGSAKSLLSEAHGYAESLRQDVQHTRNELATVRQDLAEAKASLSEKNDKIASLEYQVEGLRRVVVTLGGDLPGPNVAL